jgi:enoyl-CoA hydratase/carnithine racemase
MSDWRQFQVPVQALRPGSAPVDAPLAIVDLGAVPVEPQPLSLPSVPVIGIGAGPRWLAEQCDAVIEAPVTIVGMAAAVAAQPRAAAVTVELLRLLDGLDPAAGLVAESLAYGLLQGSAEHAAWLAARVVPAVAPPGTVRIAREDDVLRIILARPAAGNAIDAAMRDALAEAFALAAIDRTIARVVLDAEGRTFCLGADLAEFGTTRDPATAHHIRRATLPARGIAVCADRLEAHVEGACVGAGLEMAAFARRLTAGPCAWFQLPELAMGLLPGAGGCVSLTRRIGRQRTALLVLSGRRISARVACDWGLVDALVDDRSGDQRQADIGG